MLHNTEPDQPGQNPSGKDFAQPDQRSRSALPFREDRDGGTQWNADFGPAPADREAAQKREKRETRGKIIKGVFFAVILLFIGTVWWVIQHQRSEMREGGSAFGAAAEHGFFGSLPFSPMFLFVGLFVVVGVLKPILTKLWRTLQK